MASVSFALMLALLITHELDAVQRHEWRLLPVISSLSDDMGARIFVWAHVPLMLGVLWIVAQGVASGPAIGLSVFALAHLVLHWLYRNHPANTFTGVGAWLPILGAALFGAVHVALVS